MRADLDRLHAHSARVLEQYRELHGSEPRDDAPRFVQPPAGGNSLLRRAQCRQVGGIAGSETSACTFTYSVWPLGVGATSGQALASNRTPIYHQRTSIGRFEFLPGGGPDDQRDPNAGECLIFTDANGDVQIWSVCNEVPAVVARLCD